ncbi:MAG: TerC/Alx family metal homeostasis membrane protein [Bacteroidota bacterium]|nr:TerC/Alx family metal homeostasis membrane protein [Bacteroidota bacterium]
MDATDWTYTVFGILILFALVFDLGILSRRSREVSISHALLQTLFWVLLAFGFFAFLWFEDGQQKALEYMSAYLMEWSLSIDNIFVFLLIFSFFGVRDRNANRVLLYGILLAIVMRVLFITVGIVLVTHFNWILYVFGAFLVYTGIRMFLIDEENEFDPQKNVVYRLVSRWVPLVHDTGDGRFMRRVDGKLNFTMLFMVLILLAATDLVFALDSIPAVFAITQTRLIIYTSNIFAVLGLRSLFFLIRGAVNKFRYLKEGIAIVLIFIGLKMGVEILGIHIPIWVSLLMIVFCISGAMLFSIYIARKRPSGES